MKISASQSKRCLDAVEQNLCHAFWREEPELRTRLLNRLREISANGKPGDIDDYKLQGLFLKLFREPEEPEELSPTPKKEPPPAPEKEPAPGKPIPPILKNGEQMHFNVGGQ
ncbi:MAG: hypothetical protein A2Z83_07550 [Omnitrophica bacterium GWA2_52_8]|nr:MAG: hypothetical protein A2Z83_07550 [Omnitrophica bacterium GWA2_52_8]